MNYFFQIDLQLKLFLYSSL